MSKQITYLIRSDYIDIKVADAFLKSKGWRKAKPNENPDWLYEDGKFMYGRNTYKGRVKVKSMLNEQKDNIARKDLLMINLNEHYPDKKYVKTQYVIEPDQDISKFNFIFKTHPVWIIKPVFGFKGQGITIVRNTKQLKQLKRDKVKPYVIQEYILNPLLWDKKYKFHLRVRFIITSKGTCLIHNNYSAIVNTTEYINEDFDNKFIHDTHADHGTSTSNARPELIKQFGQDKFDQMEFQIHDVISKLPHLFDPKPYNESKHGFEMFGADIMFDDTFKLYLIEVNRKIGLNTAGTSTELIKFIYEATKNLLE
jgi:hypothetical protein